MLLDVLVETFQIFSFVPDTGNLRRLASPGHRAGVVGIIYFYRQEAALARTTVAPLRAVRLPVPRAT